MKRVWIFFTIVIAISIQVTLAATAVTNFAVNTGYVDVVPRQLIRTNNDKLYIFAAKAQYSNILRTYSTQGLPNTGNDFSVIPDKIMSANIISVDATYDGAGTIFVSVNTQDGKINIIPFDINTNIYKTAKLLPSSGIVSGDYIGTSGISSMVDTTGKLHFAFWNNTNHILYSSFTYDSTSNVFTTITNNLQVDSGSANHPSLVVDRNNVVTLAWVSELTSPAKILTRSITNETLGVVLLASTSPVWTSTSAGINIDQGPSLVVDKNNVVHMLICKILTLLAIMVEYIT